MKMGGRQIRAVRIGSYNSLAATDLWQTTREPAVCGQQRWRTILEFQPAIAYYYSHPSVLYHVFHIADRRKLDKWRIIRGFDCQVPQ